ncbi:hypothetical protein [Halobacillus litoralis]|uniref:hypothetical protein n=1 Tax=Halobacillus litoralis TaxID=45668 RepID=UPI001CFDF98F|nr:hypothetical protein [Halobacillus litoralis]
MNKYQRRAGVILLGLLIILLPFLNERINSFPLLILYLLLYSAVMYGVGMVMKGKDKSNQ